MNYESVSIDMNLNIKNRLQDLASWKQEWQQEDQYLESLVEQIDLRKPAEIQKGVHIVNLRRRAQMKLIDKPLEVSIKAIVECGYPQLRRFYINQFAGLTKKEQLLWLHNFKFIITPNLLELNKKIQNVLGYRSLGQQRNFLLGGPSGSGKTTDLNWLVASNRPVVGQTHNIVPVIKVDAPRNQKSSNVLFQRIILECGHTYLKSAKDEELLQLVIVLFQKCQVRLLMVDEIEHLMKDEFRRRLLEVSNLTHGVSIICASCNPLNWVVGDDEVKGRWNDYFYLEPFTGEKLSGLLSYIELLLPFTQSSFLPEFQLTTPDGSTTNGPADLIQKFTGGILRDIMILIADACTKAIEANQSCLSPELLKKSWDDIQKKQVTDFLDLMKSKE